MKRFLMILVAMAFAGCSFGYTPPSKASDMAGDTLADSQDSNDGDSDDETNFNPPLPVEDEPLPDLADVATNTDSTDMPDTDTPANTDSDVDNGLDVAEPKADALDTLAETETMIVPPCVVNPLLCADTPPTLLDAEVATTEPTTAEQPMAESNASESAMVEFATVEPTVAVELATAESIATVEFG
ncbi:MAG TPA: hypothetical protein DEF57_01710, partial [Candidatus Magasanikbacteria bacterium]|nr:hypothetical protein [Candidatus Magasanikbacteria bacterium]